MQRMRKSVRELPTQAPHVLLACSGGKDSVALAWALAELRRLDLLTFSIAHIHHGQHDRADVAANAVREIGDTLGVDVDVHRLVQSGIDAHGGVGLEEAMRRERYLALARIAAEQAADCLSLAHHQTDQAETILLHLMRGAGIDGLAGMRAWEVRTIPWWADTDEATEIGLWRPFIRESADDVAEMAISSGLPVVEDPTNIDSAYRRNAIRHRVLPVLEEIAEGSTAAIARSAQVIAGDASLVDQVTQEALERCREGEGLSRKSLMELPGPLRVRVARAWVLKQAGVIELSAHRTQAIIELAERNRGGAVVEIGSGHAVSLRNGLLQID